MSGWKCLYILFIWVNRTLSELKLYLDESRTKVVIIIDLIKYYN
jgi:hypothetical protein